MTQEQKWLSYVAELRSKHEAEMHEYAKELQGKILDQEFTIKSLVEDNIALKEAIEINCNCNADGCHQAKLLQDKDYQIQEAWEKVHALEDDLHNSQTQMDRLKKHRDDDQILIASLTKQFSDADKRCGKVGALYEEYKTLYEKTLGRVNGLEEWLTEYRDQLKKENVYHKNTGIINAINELLDENTIHS